MNREELLTELWKLVRESNNDPEVAHSDADDLLLKYINDEEVTAAFESVRKWYA